MTVKDYKNYKVLAIARDFVRLKLKVMKAYGTHK